MTPAAAPTPTTDPTPHPGLARRSLRIRSSRWARHPAVRSPAQLTLGERAADRLRNGMGSWPFVFSSLLFLAAWMYGNGSRGFDPYPFILLNLVLSCVAALQGAILLIAARRSDQISSELAAHDYETDTRAAAVLDEVLADLHRLRADHAALLEAVVRLHDRE